MPSPIVREENSNDTDSIRHVLQQAFHNHAHSNGREFELVDILRAAKALDLSLVAEVEGQVVGHVAFSKITIAASDCNWYGLGPVAVLPNYQTQGIGSFLIREGLRLLNAQGVAGCVVLGEPDYYQRFGFKTHPDLKLEGVPAEYFTALSFDGTYPSGIVKYHPEFEVVS